MLDGVGGWNVICWARDTSGSVGVGVVVVVSVMGVVGLLGIGVLYCRSKPALSRIPASIFAFISVIFLMVASLRSNVMPSTSVRNGKGMGSNVLIWPARLQ